MLLLAQAARGEGHLITLEGEAGIGKTFLLEEALGRAEALGFRCFVGGAEELERHRPFGAASEALGIGRRGRLDDHPGPGEDERRAEIARLLAGPAAGPVDPHYAPAGAGWPRGPEHAPASGTPLLAGAPEAEFRIVDALIDFVEHLCAGGPVVVALEDLQWADPSTLLALNCLGREISRLPAVLITTLRPLPRSVDLQALLESLSARGALRLTLGRLDEASVADLVETILRVPPGPGLLEQLSRAGGNPFFATELVASLQREGAITVEHGVAEVGVAAMPSSLTSAIRRRLSFLSEEGMETLQVASILGSTFSLADLSTIIEREPAALVPYLAAAVQGGVLRTDGRLFTFHHDLIREALYTGMTHAVRHALHLSAAHALAEVGLPPEEVAEHVVRGASPGDLHAVEWLRTAARQAGTRSPAIAVELLARALEIAPAGPAAASIRDITLADLALALLSSGRLGEAEEICRRTLAQDHDPRVEGAMWLCLVQTYVGEGRLAESLLAIEEAVASPALTERERARLWAWASTCRVIIWDLDGAAATAELALGASRRIEDDLSGTIALAGLAAVQNLRGNFWEALRVTEEALAGARRSRSPEARRLQLTLVHTLMLVDVDRVEDAQQALRRGRVARERRGARWNLASYHFVSSLGRFWSGEWDEAIAQFDSAMDFAEEIVVRQGELAGHAVRSMIALHRGDLATAEREATAAEEDAVTSGPQWRPDWMMWARALLLEAQGRDGEALRMLSKAWELCSGAGVVAEYPVIGPDLVRLAVEAGERILAEEVAGAVETLAATANVASVTGAALRCRGLVDGDPAVLLEAVHAYRRSPRRRELALTCEDAAVALGAGGRSAMGRPLAEEALETYRGLEAHRDIARALSRLRGTGVRTGSAPQRAPERPRTSFGWGAVTRSEVKVAALVAEGLSNPEIARRLFISRRTVQSHVSHCLEKLGLSSRVELAVETARWHALRGGDGPDLES